MLNLDVSPAAPSTRRKVTTQCANLNIRQGPGTDQPITGKAAHESEVTLLGKYNAEWTISTCEPCFSITCFDAYTRPPPNGRHDAGDRLLARRRASLQQGAERDATDGVQQLPASGAKSGDRRPRTYTGDTPANAEDGSTDDRGAI